jgi:hypothetical protein
MVTLTHWLSQSALLPFSTYGQLRRRGLKAVVGRGPSIVWWIIAGGMALVPFGDILVYLPLAPYIVLLTAIVVAVAMTLEPPQRFT